MVGPRRSKPSSNLGPTNSLRIAPNNGFFVSPRIEFYEDGRVSRAKWTVLKIFGSVFFFRNGNVWNVTVFYWYCKLFNPMIFLIVFSKLTNTELRRLLLSSNRCILIIYSSVNPGHSGSKARDYPLPLACCPFTVSP